MSHTDIKETIDEIIQNFDSEMTSNNGTDWAVDYPVKPRHVKHFIKEAIDLVREEEREVDHNIDVRYEPDLIEMFNKFIKKWCKNHYPHLIDTDENDAQFIRDRIEELQSSLTEK